MIARGIPRGGHAGHLLLSLHKCIRAQASLANPDVAASLLAALRETGTQAQAAQLIERLPSGSAGEADVRAAKPWAWTDPC
jgi:hypothetical protein